jgi:hypothetical protein
MERTMPRNTSRRVPARVAPGRPQQRGRPVAAPPQPPAPVCNCDSTPHKVNCALVRVLTGPLVRNVRGMGKKRRDRDLYETPIPCATALCNRVARLLPQPVEPVPDSFDHGDGPAMRQRPMRIIEPSAGGGHFVQAARAVWADSKILAVDLHASNAVKLQAVGVTSYIVGRWQDQNEVMDADLHIGNPPYSEAEEHVAHSLKVMRDGAYGGFLLPVTFIATQGRCERLWTKWPETNMGVGQLRYFFALAERPSYTGDGQTDMTEYAFYLFQKGYTGNPELLPPLWWRTPGR